ncbi:MAG: MarR family transcriptional regulator [Pseudonocardia sp.]|nr:MarR family transcriptional regulator [Pseudonocardia sp.]
MTSSAGSGPAAPTPATSAFLLAQLGAHAARRFAERVATLDLTPPQSGLLRAVAIGPGQSQQDLARHLDTPPTRLVTIVDALEDRGVLERRRNPTDRRLHAIHLTDAGRRLLGEIRRVAGEHDDALVGALTPAERGQLHDLLTRVAEEQGLTEGVHPGYRNLSAAQAGSRRPAAAPRAEEA